MRSHIDWLTFTMTPIYQSSYPEGTPFEEQYAEAIGQAFLATFGSDLVSAAFGGQWSKNERSRAPYTDSWKLGESSITLFASPSLTHCCVEVSGLGCERLIKLGILHVVLDCIQKRVTRIDIATDIETETKPREFVATLAHDRMRASGYQISESGETCYVGSQKSDRYARVYRYNDPHPRSHLLRIEHVFRKEYAKNVAAKAVSSDLRDIAAAAGKAFGWAHPVWKLGDDSVVDIGIVAAERNAGKTVYWLVNSVAPAFKKLCETGVIIDPEEFITRYFLPPT